MQIMHVWVEGKIDSKSLNLFGPVLVRVCFATYLGFELTCSIAARSCSSSVTGWCPGV